MTIHLKSGSANLRAAMVGAASALAMLTTTATMAQDACTQMQVYLAIAPNHREDVMSYLLRA